MEHRRNLYNILHVQTDAPEEIIRSSYRTLMTKLRRHPDLGGDHLTATMINEAYAVLTDPAKRSAYDKTINSVAEAVAATARPAPPPVAVCQFCDTVHGLGNRLRSASTCSTCNAPLAPAVRERLDAGQRAVGRIPRRAALGYCTGWPGQGPFPGETRDLSLHGLQFVTQASVPTTKILKVDCEALAALVRVVACTDADERDWRWLIRAEYLTVRFRHPRGGFLATRA